MKLILVSCLLTFPLAAADSFLVTNLWLNHQAVVEIPVGAHRVTTLSFHRPVQSFDGAGLPADARTPGQFQVAHSVGNSSLALRALTHGASANLNVRIDDRTYVFLLTESKSPMLAVNFLGTPDGSAAAAGTLVESASAKGIPALTPMQLLGLLDRARHYQTLRQHHPWLVADVTSAQPRSITDYASFTARLDEVLRFDRTDALAEASGVIPAEGSATAWFVIQGSPDGQRNLLSPRNTFIVLVNPL